MRDLKRLDTEKRGEKSGGVRSRIRGRMIKMRRSHHGVQVILQQTKNPPKGSKKVRDRGKVLKRGFFFPAAADVDVAWGISWHRDAPAMRDLEGKK